MRALLRSEHQNLYMSLYKQSKSFSSPPLCCTSRETTLITKTQETGAASFHKKGKLIQVNTILRQRLNFSADAIQYLSSAFPDGLYYMFLILPQTLPIHKDNKESSLYMSRFSCILVQIPKPFHAKNELSNNNNTQCPSTTQI